MRQETTLNLVLEATQGEQHSRDRELTQEQKGQHIGIFVGENKEKKGKKGIMNWGIRRAP